MGGFLAFRKDVFQFAKKEGIILPIESNEWALLCQHNEIIDILCILILLNRLLHFVGNRHTS